MPVGADRLEHEAVQRTQLGVALPGQLGVQVVDERAEAGQQQQGQQEAGPRGSGVCGSGVAKFDNLVYGLVNHVD